MFTGLIEEVGSVLGMRANGKGAQLRIAAPRIATPNLASPAQLVVRKRRRVHAGVVGRVLGSALASHLRVQTDYRIRKTQFPLYPTAEPNTTQPSDISVTAAGRIFHAHPKKGTNIKACSKCDQSPYWSAINVCATGNVA